MAGLRFLPAAVPTLLLALLAEFFRFLLFVVVCRAGSALARPAKTNRGNPKNIMHTDRDRVQRRLWCAFVWHRCNVRNGRRQWATNMNCEGRECHCLHR